jgi:hypothetical protein
MPGCQEAEMRIKMARRGNGAKAEVGMIRLRILDFGLRIEEAQRIGHRTERMRKVEKGRRSEGEKVGRGEGRKVRRCEGGKKRISNIEYRTAEYRRKEFYLFLSYSKNDDQVPR